MIPQSYIDDVLARANIVDVIDARVKLKKVGKNHIACCPFHDERTPSFSVTEKDGLYYCFGCGAGGNAIGFLMDYERLAFKDAVVILGRSLGLGDPTPETKAAESIQSRIGKYSRLKAQIRDDSILIEVVKAARLKGEEISKEEAPAIAQAIRRLQENKEQLSSFSDVISHIQKQDAKENAETARRHLVMVIVSDDLQRRKDQYPPTQWIPPKIQRSNPIDIERCHKTIEAIEKATGNL